MLLRTHHNKKCCSTKTFRLACSFMALTSRAVEKAMHIVRSTDEGCGCTTGGTAKSIPATTTIRASHMFGHAPAGIALLDGSAKGVQKQSSLEKVARRLRPHIRFPWPPVVQSRLGTPMRSRAPRYRFSGLALLLYTRYEDYDCLFVLSSRLALFPSHTSTRETCA